MGRWRGRGRLWEYVNLPGNCGVGGAGAVIRAFSTSASAAISLTTSELGRRATLPTTILFSSDICGFEGGDGRGIEHGDHLPTQTVMKRILLFSCSCSSLWRTSLRKDKTGVCGRMRMTVL